MEWDAADSVWESRLSGAQCYAAGQMLHGGRSGLLRDLSRRREPCVGTEEQNSVCVSTPGKARSAEWIVMAAAALRSGISRASGKSCAFERCSRHWVMGQIDGSTVTAKGRGTA